MNKSTITESQQLSCEALVLQHLLGMIIWNAFTDLKKMKENLRASGLLLSPCSVQYAATNSQCPPNGCRDVRLLSLVFINRQTNPIGKCVMWIAYMIAEVIFLKKQLMKQVFLITSWHFRTS